MSSVWGKWSDDMQEEEKRRRRRTADGSSHWSEGKNVWLKGSRFTHFQWHAWTKSASLGEKERERNREGKRQKDECGWACLDAAVFSSLIMINMRRMRQHTCHRQFYATIHMLCQSFSISYTCEFHNSLIGERGSENGFRHSCRHLCVMLHTCHVLINEKLH